MVNQVNAIFTLAMYLWDSPLILSIAVRKVIDIIDKSSFERTYLKFELKFSSKKLFFYLYVMQFKRAFVLFLFIRGDGAVLSSTETAQQKLDYATFRGVIKAASK